MVLIGRLRMEPRVGLLTIGPVFPSSRPNYIPLLLPIADCGSESLLNEVVLIKQPRLVVKVTSEEEQFVIQALAKR